MSKKSLVSSYAPPFSSAKDPINTASYVGGNVINGSLDIISWDKIAGLDRNTTFLIDVRTQMEWAMGTIEGAHLIPVDDLRNRLHEIPRDKEIIVFCAVGLRVYIACRILKQHGFTNVKNLTGGWKTYGVVSNKRKY